MSKVIRIGTRDSQLALWQANTVRDLLRSNGFEAELVHVKSDGDIDLSTPLYEIGVQGIFTRSLDIALLKGEVDIAVHSMKDVPTQLAKGIAQAAVLKRASTADIIVPKQNAYFDAGKRHPKIATSSIRRKAQWLKKYPHATIENLRGNVNTRLRKLDESDWDGAIFAAAGLERIGVRPGNAIDLDWMLPAPAQGAIVIVGRANDDVCLEACSPLNDSNTALCTAIERDFLRELMGGCSTPISALATVVEDTVHFKGNIASVDGSQMVEVDMVVALNESAGLGKRAASKVLADGGKAILATFNK